ncbi:MAG: hypothetical protein KFF73_00605 [Cyclobacteriaceae bacterium]|nr:hypothetical protein [Cyclobacteriaceae bacterium]
MKQIISYLFIFSFLVIFFSCTSGKKAYETGNYDQSTIQAIERLRKNPDNKKSREVLAESYPLAVRYHMDRINNLRNSNDPFKNGKMIDEYERMNYLYEQVMRSPGAISVIPDPQKYYSEISMLSQLAAEEQYQAGMEALNTGMREGAKQAYQYFLQTDIFSPGYKDVREKMNESLNLATLKVKVEQIPVPTANYKISLDFFQDQVDQFLFHYSDNEFVRFFSPQDTWLEHPDQVMVLMIDEFMVGNTNNFQNSREIVRDSVVVGKIKMDDGIEKEVLGTVKASFTEYRREIVSNGLLSMRIMDGNTNRVIMHEKFPGEFVWVSSWASFNGDERALDEEQLRLSKSRPFDPPPPQELFIEFTKPIYGQLTSTIHRYYRNY